MDLNSIQERGAESRKSLESLLEKSRRQIEFENTVSEVVGGFEMQESKLIGFARALLDLSKRNSLQAWDSHVDPEQSPLIKLSNNETESIYLAVTVYKPPMGRTVTGATIPVRQKIIGYSFVACAGVEIDHDIFRNLSRDDEEMVEEIAPFRGTTIIGKYVVGSIVEKEDFGLSSTAKTSLPRQGEEELRLFKEQSEERLSNLANTVQLIQTAIADPTLNPLPAGVDISTLTKPL